MEDKLADEIIRLLKYLKDIRKPYEGTWKDVAEHIVPLREDMLLEKPEGERIASKIYDGTPISALQVFTDGYHGNMISPATVWFRLTLEISTQELLSRFNKGAMRSGPMRPHISKFTTLDDIPEVRGWLQDTGRELYRAFDRSNFYPAMTPYFEDGGSIGTATLYSEENTTSRTTVFTTFHPGSIFIAENQFGEVDTIFRTERIEAKKLKERFGLSVLGDDVKQALNNGNPYQRFPVIHAFMPRTRRDPNKKDAKNKPFSSIWVDEKNKRVLKESGYDMDPYAVWRYRKSSHETYGRSPAMFALADIMGLNLIGKDLLGAAELAVRPAYNVPSELYGKVKVIPHGFNYYGDDYHRIVTPVQSGINFPIGLDREKQKKEAIERHFHVDFFLLLQRATRQMTAYEVMERSAERSILLGTSVGRLQTDCLNPIMDRMFEIEYTAGRLPAIPEILADYGGAPIGIDYTGPLAQAQKRIFRTQGITQGLVALQPLAEVFPQVLDIIDPDITAREVLESFEFPHRAVRSGDVVESIRQARSEMEAKREQEAKITQGIDSIQKLAQADQSTGGKISGMMNAE